MNVDSMIPENKLTKTPLRKIGAFLFVAVVGAMAALAIAKSAEP